MEILYIHKYVYLYQKPRKENLVNYTKIAIFSNNKVEYGFIHRWDTLYTKKYKEKYNLRDYNILPCAIVKEYDGYFKQRIFDVAELD